MTRWGKTNTKVIIQNKYIPAPVSQVVDDSIPIGRGRSITINYAQDVVFATCIEILAKKLAQTKWKVYDNANNEVGYLTSLFNKTLNIQPYPGINAYDMWEHIEKQRLGYGNAFCYICDSGLDTQIVPLDAAYVTMYWDDANILDAERKIWYQYVVPDENGKKRRTYTIPAENMLHFKSFSANGLLGRPAINVLRNTLDCNAEIEGATRSTVVNGFAGSIILSYTADLSQSKRKELASQVKEFMQASDHSVVPLPAGVTTTNINNDVKSYHEILKRSNAEDISALFGIPLVMLNKGTGSGVATLSTNQITQFHTSTIAPILSQYANELTVKLLTPKQIGKGFKFDTDSDGFDYLDAESKSRVLCAYVNAGILKRNEARLSLMYTKLNDPVAEALTANGVGGSLGDNAGKNGGGDNTSKGAQMEE